MARRVVPWPPPPSNPQTTAVPQTAVAVRNRQTIVTRRQEVETRLFNITLVMGVVILGLLISSLYWLTKLAFLPAVVSFGGAFLVGLLTKREMVRQARELHESKVMETKALAEEAHAQLVEADPGYAETFHN